MGHQVCITVVRACLAWPSGAQRAAEAMFALCPKEGLSYQVQNGGREANHKPMTKTASLVGKLLWASSCVIAFVCCIGIILWVLLETHTYLPPETTVKSGQLRGKWLQSRDNRDIAAFEGIPYAAPPTGKRRFKDPDPVSPWTGVYYATEAGSSCPQASDGAVIGAEDCLYLNVYTPEGVDHATSLDVFFYIHGGGWGVGSGDLYQPDYLLDRDIILVTFNYRLNVLGFLYSKAHNVTGNFGLKDAVAALTWVRDNIASFGGNPESVTIAGQSAGAGTVHILMFSQLARGLFHKAFALSGSALAPWTVAPPTEPALQTARLAEALNCSLAELLDCLTDMSAAEIITIEGKAFNVWRSHPYIPFKAVVEEGDEGAFLSRYPQDLMATSGPVSDVPFMTGFTSQDGDLFAVGILTNDTASQEFDVYFEELFPVVAMLTNRYEEQVLRQFMNKTRHFYLGDQHVSNGVSWELINMFTDCAFTCPLFETSKLQNVSGKSPIFLYEFGYQSEQSYATSFGAVGTEYGVCHGDDLFLLFPLSSVFPTYVRTSEDEEMSRRYIDFIVTFANTGRPTRDDTWPASTDAGEYLVLKAPNNITVHSRFHPETLAWWRQLPLIQYYDS